MADPVNLARVGSIADITRDADTAPAPRAGEPNFSEILADAVTSASGAEKNAEQMAERFAAGDPDVGIHEVMIASEKANISVRYAVTLKNKLLEAYRDLMNTQV